MVLESLRKKNNQGECIHVGHSLISQSIFKAKLLKLLSSTHVGTARLLSKTLLDLNADSGAPLSFEQNVAT